MAQNIWRKYRWLVRFISVFVILAILIPYIILFTPPGNRLLQPWIEISLSDVLETPVQLETFELDHSSLLIRFSDDAQNQCTVGTSFSLLTFKGHGYYRIDLNTPLSGINRFNTPMKLIGSLSGGYNSLSILGSLQFHDGAIPYKIELHNFSLETLNLYLSNVDYASLVSLFDIPADTDTKLNGHILLKGFSTRTIEGSVVLDSQTDSFKPVPIDKDDNDSFDIAEFLADENGFIERFDINVSSKIALDESGILDPLLETRTKGPVAIEAKLTGNHLQTRLHITTALAQSRSDAQIVFLHLEPHTIRYDISKADLGKLFNFFNLNPPLLGTLSSKGEFNTTQGSLSLHLANARTVPDVLKKEYAITQPSMTFNSDIGVQINPKNIHYQGTFQSDLKQLSIDTDTTHPQMLSDLLKLLP